MNELDPVLDAPYRRIRNIFRFLLRLTSHLCVEGLDHLPRRGPLIMVTNHLHLFDPVAVMAALPTRSTVLAAEKWERHWLFRHLFDAIGAVYINRGEADIRALKKTEELLKQGAIVGIAPEGTRSKTGGLQQGKGGAALLASRTGAPLVPVVAYGQEKLLRGLSRLRRTEVVVRVGEAFTLSPARGVHRSQQIEEMTQEIMLRLARLLPPSYRGVYRPLVTENDERSDLSVFETPGIG